MKIIIENFGNEFSSFEFIAFLDIKLQIEH